MTVNNTELVDTVATICPESPSEPELKKFKNTSEENPTANTTPEQSVNEGDDACVAEDEEEEGSNVEDQGEGHVSLHEIAEDMSTEGTPEAEPVETPVVEAVCVEVEHESTIECQLEEQADAASVLGEEAAPSSEPQQE